MVLFVENISPSLLFAFYLDFLKTIFTLWDFIFTFWGLFYFRCAILCVSVAVKEHSDEEQRLWYLIPGA